MCKNIYNLFFSKVVLAVLIIAVLTSPPVIKNAYGATESNIEVTFLNNNTDSFTQTISINFKVTNVSSESLNLSDVKLRYYFTDDGVSPLTLSIDHAGNEGVEINSNIIYSINSISATDADKYVEIGFDDTTGMLLPGNSTVIQSRLHHSYYSGTFDQTNDYSFSTTNTEYAPWNKVTGYLNDNLVSGIEPHSESGSKTPEPTAEPTAEPTPEPTAQPTSEATPEPTSEPETSPTPDVEALNYEGEDMYYDINLSRIVESEVEFGDYSDIQISQEAEFSKTNVIEQQKEIALVMDNSGSLSSYTEDIVTPFDYGIYALDTLHFTGNDVYINGSTYSRNLISLAGNFTITDAATFKEKTISGNAHIENELPYSDHVDMPYFHSELMVEAYGADYYFDPDVFFPHDEVKDMPGQEGIHIRYESDIDTFIITSDYEQTFNIDSSMYFKGNIQITLDEVVNTSQGFLVADGDIDVEGHQLSYTEDNNRLNLYSINGNISFYSSDSEIKGIAYAPGNPSEPETSGEIVFKGNGNIISGSMAAQNFTFQAGDVVFNHDINDLEEIKTKYFQKSTYLDSIKQSAKELINSLSGTQTKMAVIQYSDSANANDFNLYDLSVEGNDELLKNKIDNITSTTEGFSNMGDALRRANHILTNSSQTSEHSMKHMIVLSGSAPNKWTSNNPLGTEAKTTIGDAIHIMGDGTSDSDGSSLEYAKTIGNNIESDNIETIYIDFSSDEDVQNKLEEIANASGSKTVTDTGRKFYSPDSILELPDIFDSIELEIMYSLMLDKIKYQEIFPEGVRVIEVPEGMEVESLELNGGFRDKVTGVFNDVSLNFDGDRYIMDKFSFDVQVRYVTAGEVNYKGTDGSISYTINYLDENGEEVNYMITKNLDDLTLYITMSVDIG
ncbi:cellulose binding domain-containing protein [Herbivorax sp. ANBcel31]|uniref:cellulose binding domain-containing protein n=1 Tax=Herbivorax sp. ANBcel31 TaxID=3069754 RepID=UPI0027B7E82D|nr:cellulose binding domain-containing protein [Herbivorax sp. ANBcel31]MDQ2087653.1 cellulose binding domain-containing protein [Herbivorax sp. ANBcel31]